MKFYNVENIVFHPFDDSDLIRIILISIQFECDIECECNEIELQNCLYVITSCVSGGGLWDEA